LPPNKPTAEFKQKIISLLSSLQRANGMSFYNFKH